MDLAFGDVLRRARERACLTQQELAERAGLTVNAISQLERGVRTRPYPHTVRVLADALALDDDERAVFLAAVPGRARHPDPGRAAADPLPGPQTAVFGRDEDLAILVRLIDTHRLVTLTGPGGVGKTTLARMGAAAVAGRFPGGVTVVELADVDDVEMALLAIARQAGRHDTGGVDVRGFLRSRFQGAAHLLVLDNLEHLPALIPDVSGLLGAAPELSVLATSRAPLRLRTEHELPVGPLPVPEAVQLLLAHSQPTHSLGPEDAATLTDISRRLDGLPLALELAAGWLRVLTPRELADRLAGALQLLDDGPRDLPERHRSLRAAIAWSDRLLTDRQLRLFHELSVLPGTWDLTTAAAVSDQPEADVLRGVADLVERNLVVRVGNNSDGLSQFRMLETVRAYGLEQLEQQAELEPARRRLAVDVIAFVADAFVGLAGADQARWLDRVEERLPDVRATLRWAVERGEAEFAAHCYAGLFWVWYLRHLTEGRTWGAQVVEVVAHADAASQARVGATSALITMACGDPATALTIAATAAERATAAGDVDGALLSLAVHANAAAMLDDSAGVDWATSQLAALAPATDSGLLAMARASVTLARVRRALACGDLDTAEHLLAEAEDHVDAAGTAWLRVLWLNVAVGADQVVGRHDRSRPRLRQSLALSLELRDAPATLYALGALAVDSFLRGDVTEAAQLLGSVESHAGRTGHRLTDPVTLGLLATVRTGAEQSLGSDRFRTLLREGTMVAPHAVLAAIA